MQGSSSKQGAKWQNVSHVELIKVSEIGQQQKWAFLSCQKLFSFKILLPSDNDQLGDKDQILSVATPC